MSEQTCCWRVAKSERGIIGSSLVLDTKYKKPQRSTGQARSVATHTFPLKNDQRAGYSEPDGILVCPLREIFEVHEFQRVRVVTKLGRA